MSGMAPDWAVKTNKTKKRSYGTMALISPLAVPSAPQLLRNSVEPWGGQADLLTEIPEAKRRAIQNTLSNAREYGSARRREITQLSHTVQARNAKVAELQKQLATKQYQASHPQLNKQPTDEMRRIAELEAELDKLKSQLANQDTTVLFQVGEREQFEDFARFQTDLLNIGGNVLAERNEKVRELSAANQQLHVTIGQRDSTILALNQQVTELIAVVDPKMKMPVEAQAQHTLTAVKGSQGDVARGETEIQYYKKRKKNKKSNAQVAANVSCTTQSIRLANDNTRLEPALAAERSKSEQVKQLVENQMKLIQKLLADTHRLSNGQ